MNIYEVAKECGVSPATVSRVINNSDRVSDKTREKVLQIIERMNFTPSTTARNLSIGQTKKVGIVCKNIADSFYAEAISLVENNLRLFGYDSLLYSTYGDVKEKTDGIARLSNEVDALVFIGSIFDSSETKRNPSLKRIASNTPIIIINGFLPDYNICGVVSDEVGMMKNIICTYCNMNLCHTLYIHDSVSTYSGQSKMRGYEEALSTCNIAICDNLILQVPRSIDDAQEIIESKIIDGVVFDSIIASEDLFAVAAQKALSKYSISVPIVSFNNSVLAVCANPQLSSVDFLLDTMCSTAINMLSNKLNSKPVPERVIIQPSLIVRDSFVPANLKILE